MKIYGSKTIKVLLIFSIDDMLILFFVFSIMRMMLNYFDLINSQHPNIKFTIEKEANKALVFLDGVY